MRIAFIGLGNMGAPMALNLQKAGHEVTGFDPVAAPDRIPCAASAADAAQGAEVAITMLPHGGIARAVADEVLATLPKGALLIDCSTIEVEAARAIANAATAKRVGFLDAPVSGGVGGHGAR